MTLELKFPSATQNRARKFRGFTLTELLVTITIIAVLGLVTFAGMRSMRAGAHASVATASLRQNAIAIQGFIAEKGRYPEAWDFRGGSGGGAWSWQLRDYFGYTGLASWPSETLLHPRHGRKGISDVQGWDRENLHHFAASAVLFQDVNDTKSFTRAAAVKNPATTIMLGDAPLKSAGVPGGGCHAAWWSIRESVVRGSPNVPINKATLTSSVDFWFKGKAHFLFADGHVEALAPEQILRKHFQL